MKKVKKSSQSQSCDFDFFGNLKKVKVMTLFIKTKKVKKIT
jgi:hypothetical protein